MGSSENFYSNRNRKRVVYLLLLFLPAVGLTAWLTRCVANSNVDVGLDLISAPSEAPVLGVAKDGRIVPISTMEEIDERFSPHHFWFRLAAPEMATIPGLSDEVEVIVNTSPDALALEPEGAWGYRGIYFVLHGGNRPASMTQEGRHFGPEVSMVFRQDARSGDIVLHTTRNNERRLSLFRAEAPDRLTVTIPCDGRVHRYYGRVPRRTLKALTLMVGQSNSNPTAQIDRLYINTIFPHVFWSGSMPPRRPLGHLTPHWQPPWKGNTLQLGSLSPLEQGGIVTFLTIFFLLLLSMAICFVVLGRLPASLRPIGQPKLPAYDVAPPRFVHFFLFFIPLAIVWTFFLLNFYPGTMNLDSLDHWREAHRLSFDHIHPVLYPVLIRLITRFWDSPASVALVQILSMAALQAYAFSLLVRARVPKVIIAACYVCVALSLKNSTMAIALIKDTPYAILLLAVSVLLFRLLLLSTGGRLFSWWAALCLALLLLPLFRYNGFLVLLGTAVLLPFFFPRARRGALAVTSFLVLVSLGAGCLLAFTLRGANPVRRAVPSLITGHLAVLIDRDVPLSNKEYAFLNQVRLLDDRWAYDKLRMAPTTVPVSECYDTAFADKNLPAYTNLYGTLILRNPLLATKYFLERSEYIYLPFEHRGAEMESYFLGISRNELRLASMQFLVDTPIILRKTLAWSDTPTWNWLFWRPAIPLYIALAGMIIHLVRRRDPRWLILYLPLLINTVSLILTAISQNSRYQFPLTFAASFLFASAFVPAPHSSHVNREGKTARNAAPS